jgi:hypothetical protein
MSAYGLKQRIQDHLSFNWQYYCAIVALAAVFYLIVSFAEHRRNSQLAYVQWPSVKAKIAKSNIHFHPTEAGMMTQIRLVLVYSVEGKSYQSVYDKNPGFSARVDYSSIAQGREISIRYSPNDPLAFHFILFHSIRPRSISADLSIGLSQAHLEQRRPRSLANWLSAISSSSNPQDGRV